MPPPTFAGPTHTAPLPATAAPSENAPTPASTRDSICPPSTIKPPTAAHFQPIAATGAIAYSNDGLQLSFPATQSTAVVHALTPLGLNGVDRAFAWAPDGTRIAFLYTNLAPEPCATGYLMIANLQTAEVRSLLSRPGMFGRPVWSPDGQQLALTEQNAKLDLVRVSDGAVRMLSGDAVAGVTPAWLDNEHVIFARRIEPGRDVALVSQALDGSEPRVILAQAGALSSFAISPDRKMLAYYRGSLTLMDLVSNVEHDLGIVPSERLQWSPDGQFLLARGGERGLFLVQRAAPESVTQLDVFGVPGSPAWSPDGRHLALLVGPDGELPHIGMYELSTGKLSESPVQVQPPYDLAWSNH